MTPSRPMPRNPEGRVEGWQPWPRWRVTRHGLRWHAWGPTATPDATHPCDAHFASFTEAWEHASQKAREQ